MHMLRNTAIHPKQENALRGKIEAVAVEARAKLLILFGGHSSGVTNKSKFALSHRVTAAVKAASSESQNKLRKGGWI